MKERVRKGVKMRILEGIGRDQLTTFRFTLEEAGRDLRWEHPGEFEYQGNMYDVVARTASGDTIELLCYHDHRESVINKQIKNLTERTQQHEPFSRQHQKHLQRFLQTPFVFSSLNYQVPDLSGAFSIHPGWVPACLRGYPDHPLPPPEV